MTHEKSKVLLVDDFELPRTLLKKTLGEMGFGRINEAVEGRQAWKMLNQALEEKDPYTVMFTDINMPGMSGTELLLACRADPRLKALPIIIVSAEGEVENVTTALEQGANEFVIKPFAKENLIKRVERLSRKLAI